MWEQIIQWDKSVLLALNGSDSLFWDGFMMTVTKAVTWTPMIFILLYVILKNRGWRSFLFTLLFVGLVILICDQTASGFCKPYFHRFRPTHDPEICSLVDIVNGKRGGQYGFFSSHASNTFGLATFVSLLLRNRLTTCILFSYAIICSYSRIYLGLHFPGDILVGMSFGIFTGSVLYLIYYRLCNKWFPMRTLCSGIYTSTGYLKSDLIYIPLFYVLTFCYIVIRSVVYASVL